MFSLEWSDQPHVATGNGAYGSLCRVGKFQKMFTPIYFLMNRFPSSWVWRPSANFSASTVVNITKMKWQRPNLGYGQILPSMTVTHSSEFPQLWMIKCSHKIHPCRNPGTIPPSTLHHRCDWPEYHIIPIFIPEMKSCGAIVKWRIVCAIVSTTLEFAIPAHQECFPHWDCKFECHCSRTFMYYLNFHNNPIA